MILKETIKKTVVKQKEELKQLETGIKRDLNQKIDFDIKHANIITGIRRCGKSTVLRQLMKTVKNKAYFNFEDPRIFKFELTDFEKLDEVLNELNKDLEFYFFDEIQNVEGWERFVRQKLDQGGKIFLTGSNASLLSRELGTKLTGRQISHELFPFSYKEMLQFLKLKPSLKTFEKYFELGGFPEFLEKPKTELLQELFKDVLTRDIIVRHKIKDTKKLKELATYLITNIGKEYSYNNLAKILNLGSTNTVSSYISFFEDSYLFFTIPRFDYSLKKQMINPKKIFCIDLGFARANTASFSSDKGRLLENLIFIELRRKYKEIFYYRNRHECDFIIKENGKLIQAIQVCYELTEENKERELNGLYETMRKFKIENGLIITFAQEDKLNDINVIPAWKWMSKNLADKVIGENKQEYDL
ncbi:ATP-binding protein [Candidatus Woesearchaeota archaeon]|jgi:uncharacterized protein|nr:ATP-binding protein [Candidatus Woesearchaeota archaeon]MBT6518579.1 ATP-binding protein [Candidatus Woesearchaeota archaeon]MBT7367444.1 ATP-binding protein [Candidatus Woesearchaeota archaeon]